MTRSLPEVRSGLPVPAAQFAAERSETLPYSEALLDAREATPAIDDTTLDVLRLRLCAPTAAEIVALIAEIDRLRVLEADRVTLLDGLAYTEASKWDPFLKSALRRIDDDCYMPWSGGSDGPAACGFLTREEALARGWRTSHLDRADADAAKRTDRIIFNRAGPREAFLTVDALKEAYASPEAHREFRLTPEKLQVHKTSGGVNPETGEWDDKYVHWVPWGPDEVPEALPDGWRDRF